MCGTAWLYIVSLQLLLQRPLSESGIFYSAVPFINASKPHFQTLFSQSFSCDLNSSETLITMRITATTTFLPLILFLTPAFASTIKLESRQGTEFTEYCKKNYGVYEPWTGSCSTESMFFYYYYFLAPVAFASSYD